MVKEITEKYLLNKNGKLEGQRLKERWFTKNHLEKEWAYLQSISVLDTKSLYTKLHSTTDKCECGETKRFISFKDGFKKHCEKCARSKYNHMKTESSEAIEEDVDFLLRVEITEKLSTLKDINGNFSTTKIKKNPELISKIISTTYYMDRNIGERIYHVVNDLYEIPKCKTCGGDLDNFFSNNLGYRTDYCKKNNCARTSPEQQGSREASLKHFYNKHIEGYNRDINQDYTHELFSFDEYKEHKKDSIVKIKHNCGHEYDITIGYQGHLKCPKCFPVRSKIQYNIYDKFKDYVLSYNDRQLIKPKEIDIMFKDFGIEYDGMVYHSYGKSPDERFNNTLENKNCHLEKTQLMESKDYQLFRIFSTEWINKREIWESVINSKLGVTERIYARKCEVKEISSKESNEFMDANHLQGRTNGSIRIGLFYEDQLVQVMTFGKSRYKKDIQYELIRMCNKINITVTGGAGKLLKYFEREYNPESIVSYANRRWSQGNVYEKLGFEFIGNTKPNYFYFKGGDGARLLSRVQFQKHKLKEKLEIFDQNLTETENVYNNGYRKIYDCGNKIYVKRYEI